MSAAPNMKPTNPLMDKNFLNAFVEGVVKTMSMMAQTEVRPGAPKVETKFQAKGEVAGMVGMVFGQMKGTLTISYQRNAIFKILENMLGEQYAEVSTEVCDAVGEMTNQIYGASKTTLNQLGYTFEMAIPTVIKGEFTISKYHNGATLVVPFAVTGTDAVFFIEVTVQV